MSLFYLKFNMPASVDNFTKWRKCDLQFWTREHMKCMLALHNSQRPEDPSG